MKKIIKLIINFIFGFFPVRENKLLFECGRGMIDGSPKALYQFIKDNYSEDYKLMWLVNKDADTNGMDKKDYCYYHTFKAFFHQATSKYWIKSESIGSILKKKKKQVYIQAWHGHGAMKKMANDLTKGNTEQLSHTKEWDYLLVNDKLDEKIMLSSTGYKGKTVMLGTPLTDYVLKNSSNDEFKKHLKEQLGIKNNKPIVFYAPTFRDDDLKKDIVDLKIDRLSSLKDCNILIRLHPLIRNKLGADFYTNHKNFINCNMYPDATDLLCITDVLISDYSSIVYEYSVTEKPIVFYAYDEQYYKKTRGFYIDYPDELPGVVVYNEIDLVKEIKSSIDNPKKEIKKIKRFNKKYNYLCDGHVCEKFVKMLKNNEFK